MRKILALAGIFTLLLAGSAAARELEDYNADELSDEWFLYLGSDDTGDVEAVGEVEIEIGEDVQPAEPPAAGDNGDSVRF